MSAAKNRQDDLAAKSFEEALQELEGIVSKLEGGNAALEESIALYEQGARLKAHCEAKLKAAREKIEKIILNDDPSGQVQVEAAPAQFD